MIMNLFFTQILYIVISCIIDKNMQYFFKANFFLSLTRHLTFTVLELLHVNVFILHIEAIMKCSFFLLYIQTATTVHLFLEI